MSASEKYHFTRYYYIRSLNEIYAAWVFSGKKKDALRFMDIVVDTARLDRALKLTSFFKVLKHKAKLLKRVLKGKTFQPKLSRFYFSLQDVPVATIVSDHKGLHTIFPANKERPSLVCNNWTDAVDSVYNMVPKLSWNYISINRG